MSVTPETLRRHELNGLSVTVSAARNPDLEGIAGRVVRETHHTLAVRPPDARADRIVPKRGTTFAFVVDDGTVVEIDGDRLVGPPARRTEQGGVSPWV